MILLLCFMAHVNAWVDKALDKASDLRIISARSCLKKEVKKVSGMFLKLLLDSRPGGCVIGQGNH
jgi:hypothetical protein